MQQTIYLLIKAILRHKIFDFSNFYFEKMQERLNC